MRQPVIFMGMHRSGTSMLGRLLESLGLFLGTRKDKNNEAIFFRQLNEWLMAQCGARWDMPEATHHLWGNGELLSWIEGYLRYLLDSPRAIQFLGLRRYFMTSGITGLAVPWGWKDPRNTFTLPVWLGIFPEAKIVYVERHGVDVAQSLLSRSRKGFADATRRYRKYRPLVSLYMKRGGVLESPRCASLEGGFSLWQEYTEQATRIIKQLDNHRVLELRYENVLENPITHLQATAEFCGLEVPNQRLEAITMSIDRNRAYPYVNDPELREFARDHRVALTKRGYRVG